MSETVARLSRPKEALSELAGQISALNYIIKKQSEELDSNRYLIADLKLGLKKAKLEAQDAQILLDYKYQEFDDLMQAQKTDFEDQFGQINVKYKAIKQKLLDLSSSHAYLQDKVSKQRNNYDGDLEHYNKLLKDAKAKYREFYDESEQKIKDLYRYLKVQRQSASDMEIYLKLQISQRDAEIYQQEAYKAEIRRDLYQYISDLYLKFQQYTQQKQTEFDMLQEKLQYEKRGAVAALSESYTKLKCESDLTNQELERQLNNKIDYIRELQLEAQKERFSFYGQLKLFKEQITALQAYTQAQQAAKPARTTFDSLAVSVQNENAELNRTVEQLSAQVHAQYMELHNVYEEYGIQIRYISDDLKTKYESEKIELRNQIEAGKLERAYLQRLNEQLGKDVEALYEQIRKAELRAVEKLDELSNRLQADEAQRLSRQENDFKYTLAKLQTNNYGLKAEALSQAYAFAKQSDFQVQQARYQIDYMKEQMVSLRRHADESVSLVKQQYEQRMLQQAQQGAEQSARIAQLLGECETLQKRLSDERQQHLEHTESLRKQSSQECYRQLEQARKEFEAQEDTTRKHVEELVFQNGELRAQCKQISADARAELLVVKRESELLQQRALGAETAAGEAEAGARSQIQQLNEQIERLHQQLSTFSEATSQKVAQVVSGYAYQIATLSASYEDVEAKSRQKYYRFISQLQSENAELRALVGQLNRDIDAVQAEKHQLLGYMRFEKEQELARLKSENATLAQQLDQVESRTQGEVQLIQSQMAYIVEQSKMQNSLRLSRIEQSRVSAGAASASARLKYSGIAGIKEQNAKLQLQIEDQAEEIAHLTLELKNTTQQARERVGAVYAENQRLGELRMHDALEAQNEAYKVQLLVRYRELEIQQLQERAASVEALLAYEQQETYRSLKEQADKLAEQQQTQDQTKEAALEKLLEELYAAQHSAVMQNDAAKRTTEMQLKQYKTEYDRLLGEQRLEVEKLEATVAAKEKELLRYKLELERLSSSLSRQQAEHHYAYEQFARQIQQLYNQVIDSENRAQDTCVQHSEALEKQYRYEIESKAAKFAELQQRQQNGFRLQRFRLEKQIETQLEEIADLKSQIYRTGESAFEAENDCARKLQQQRMKAYKYYQLILQLVIGLKQLYAEFHYIKNELAALRAVQDVRMPDHALIVSAIVYTAQNMRGAVRESPYALAKGNLLKAQLKAAKCSQMQDFLAHFDRQKLLCRQALESAARQSEELSRLQQASSLLAFRLYQAEEQTYSHNAQIWRNQREMRLKLGYMQYQSSYTAVSVVDLQQNWLERKLPVEEQMLQLSQKMQLSRAEQMISEAQPQACEFCQNLAEIISRALQGSVAFQEARAFVSCDFQQQMLQDIEQLWQALRYQQKVQLDIPTPVPTKNDPELLREIRLLFDMLDRYKCATAQLLPLSGATEELIPALTELKKSTAQELEKAEEFSEKLLLMACKRSGGSEQPYTSAKAEDIEQLARALDALRERLRGLGSDFDAQQEAYELGAERVLRVAKAEMQAVFDFVGKYE